MSYRHVLKQIKEVKSTIVEIINVLQTQVLMVQAYLIYNSRNYKCLIDPLMVALLPKIYNSRNYKCLIDCRLNKSSCLIYNSRNYKCLIDLLYGQLQAVQSTIVEIINVLQTLLRIRTISLIYNSRNYKCLIDVFVRCISSQNLQQQKL